MKKKRAKKQEDGFGDPTLSTQPPLPSSPPLSIYKGEVVVVVVVVPLPFVIQETTIITNEQNNNICHYLKIGQGKKDNLKVNYTLFYPLLF
jgi:hypothetical protein